MELGKDSVFVGYRELNLYHVDNDLSDTREVFLHSCSGRKLPAMCSASSVAVEC